MEAKDLKKIVEALLIVSGEGLTREELVKAIDDTDAKKLEEAITLLKEEYSSEDRAFNIAEIAGKCRIVSKPAYMQWINSLYEREPERLSAPALETLAIMAYKQPVTRAEAEKIRGVNVGGVLKTLLEKDLLEVRGRKDAIGKPLIYGTTDKFLQIFGLNSLADLPQLRDFTEEDLEYGKKQEGMIIENESIKETIDNLDDREKTDGVSENQEEETNISENTEEAVIMSDDLQTNVEENNNEAQKTE